MSKTCVVPFKARQIRLRTDGKYPFVAIAATIAASLVISTVALAQDSGATISSAQPRDVWDVTAGGGVGVRPTYEGSDKHRVTALPFVQATYNDMFSFGIDGLSGFLHRDNFRFGVGLTYNAGRKDYKTTGIISSGDDRLHGMGEISGAPGIKLFGSYLLGGVNLNGAMTKFAGSDNRGMTGNVGMDLPFSVSERLIMTAHGGAIWANQEYLQTFFGVTPTQATNSSFNEYTPNAGWKGVDLGIKAVYHLDRHWFISTNLGVKKLEGDAAKSPLVFSRSEAVFLTVLGYHF